MVWKACACLAIALLGTTDSYGATIYRCKSYEGGMFWSSASCATHNALIDRIATVPDGMPFPQQVDVASQAAGNVQHALKIESDSREKARTCYQIKAEFDRIWRKYEDGLFVPAEQVGPDQIRWKELKARKAQAGCPVD